MGDGAINRPFSEDRACAAISQTRHWLGTGWARRGDLFPLITKRKKLSVVR
jgi:hypothetical protein